MGLTDDGVGRKSDRTARLAPRGLLQQRGDAGDFSDLHGAQDGTAKQSRPGALLTVILVDRQAVEHQHRNRVRPVSLHGAGYFGVADRAGRQAVAADQGLSFANDISARRPIGSVLCGTAVQPVIERGLATHEVREAARIDAARAPAAMNRTRVRHSAMRACSG